MKSFSCKQFLIAITVGLLSTFASFSPAIHVWGAEEEFKVRSLDAWANVFGKQTAKFHFTVEPPAPPGSNLIWLLSSSERRTLARGSVLIETDKPEADKSQAGQEESHVEPHGVEVAVEMPAVKDGVTLPARLEVALQVGSNSTAAATCEKELLIFPADPFIDRSQWLKDLKINLFDPAGTTAALFEKYKIPFRPVIDAPKGADEMQGLLILGERIPLKDFPDLFDELAKLATRGVSVLCLATAEGQWSVPGSNESARAAPSSLTFADRKIIHQLDKRLDASGWPIDGRIASRRFQLIADEGRVLGEVDSRSDGWVWMEAIFSESGGRLILCQLDLIQKWDAGPNPRYLFASILETLTPAVIETREGNQRP